MTVDPIHRSELYKLVLEAEASFWPATEIKYVDDCNEYQNVLDDPKRRLVKYMLIFFASGDQIIGSNAGQRLAMEIPFPESKMFYAYQSAIEVTHARVYSSLLYAILPNEDEREQAIAAIQEWDSIRNMIEYISDAALSDKPLALRLFRMICIEGVMFQSPFLWIYWLQECGMMPGLCQSNSLIAPDEWLHVLHGIAVYRLLLDNCRLHADEIRAEADMVTALCSKFIDEALPSGLPGMCAEGTLEHVKHIFDSILVLLGYEKLYNVTSRYTFMRKLGMERRDDFFEVKVTSYSQQRSLVDGTVTNVSGKLEFVESW